MWIGLGLVGAKRACSSYPKPTVSAHFIDFASIDAGFLQISVLLDCDGAMALGTHPSRTKPGCLELKLPVRSMAQRFTQNGGRAASLWFERDVPVFVVRMNDVHK